MNYKRRERIIPDPRDHCPIVVERGYQRFLCWEFDKSPSTISKWLEGNFRDESPNAGLAKVVRERARVLQKGKQWYIARNDDESYSVFEHPPRRDLIRGIWRDPLDSYAALDETGYMSIPDYLVPEGLGLSFEKNKVAVIFIKAMPAND